MQGTACDAGESLIVRRILVALVRSFARLASGAGLSRRDCMYYSVRSLPPGNGCMAQVGRIASRGNRPVERASLIDWWSGLVRKSVESASGAEARRAFLVTTRGLLASPHYCDESAEGGPISARLSLQNGRDDLGASHGAKGQPGQFYEKKINFHTTVLEASRIGCQIPRQSIRCTLLPRQGSSRHQDWPINSAMKRLSVGAHFSASNPLAECPNSLSIS
jgi:hypothetical protein